MAEIELTGSERAGLSHLITRRMGIRDARSVEEMEAYVAEIIGNRLAAPFACQTHRCGECGGCKANRIRDLLSEAQATETVLRGEIRRTEAALETFDDMVEQRDREAARAARAMDRLARITLAMVEEYGSFDGHDVWCPKSPGYETVSDRPRGDRPCDCFAGALRTALADPSSRPVNPADPTDLRTPPFERVSDIGDDHE